MSGQNGIPAGWYPDPSDSQRVRYWDSVNWSCLSHPASPRAATSGFPESSASTRVARPWWQTWLAIVQGLLLCLPLGLLAACGDATSSSIPAGTPSESPSVSPSPPPASASPPSASPSPSLARVPAVEGFGLVKAKRELRAAGLDVGDIDRRPSSKKKDTVLQQGVAKGTEVEPGSRVALVVAAPLPRVPSVVGKSEASAIRSVKNAGFTVKKTTQTRSSGRDGVVLSQSPSGGTRAKPNSVVRIVISNVQRSPDAGASRNCTPGYTPCLPPASDYDCAGGSGNGPKYTGPVRVTGSDPYDLDRDGDGVGCES
jgi:hypothetical protein